MVQHWLDSHGSLCMYCGSNAKYDSWLFIDIESDWNYYLMHGASPCSGDLVCPCIIKKMSEWTKVAATQRVHTINGKGKAKAKAKAEGKCQFLQRLRALKEVDDSDDESGDDTYSSPRLKMDDNYATDK